MPCVRRLRGRRRGGGGGRPWRGRWRAAAPPRPAGSSRPARAGADWWGAPRSRPDDGGLFGGDQAVAQRVAGRGALGDEQLGVAHGAASGAGVGAGEVGVPVPGRGPGEVCLAILRSSTSARAAASTAARCARSVSHAAMVSTISSAGLAAQRMSSTVATIRLAAARTPAGPPEMGAGGGAVHGSMEAPATDSRGPLDCPDLSDMNITRRIVRRRRVRRWRSSYGVSHLDQRDTSTSAGRL